MTHVTDGTDGRTITVPKNVYSIAVARKNSVRCGAATSRVTQR